MSEVYGASLYRSNRGGYPLSRLHTDAYKPIVASVAIAQSINLIELIQVLIVMFSPKSFPSTPHLSLQPKPPVQQMLKPKDLILLRLNQIWRIESGIVRTYTWDEDGHVITLGFWGNGNLIGRLFSSVWPYEIECLTAVTLQQYEPTPQELQQALLLHIWKTEELLRIVHQRDISKRLLRLLAWLASRFGQTETDGIRLDLPLTHQQLADTIGSTRVSITRLLQRFETEDKIRRLGYIKRRSPSSYLILDHTLFG